MNKTDNIIGTIFNPDPEIEQKRLEMLNKSYCASLHASVVQNIATVAAFTILAVTFQQWWIALFAIFFMRDYTKPNSSGSGKKKEE